MSDEREREHVRWLQARKLAWHQKLIADPEMHKGGAPLAFAGLVLHRYHIKLGYAEISVNYAMAKLRMPETTVQRARRLLVARHWIVLWKPPVPPKRRRPDMPQRYALAGGPDDLLLDELEGVTDGTPVMDDIPE